MRHLMEKSLVKIYHVWLEEEGGNIDKSMDNML